MKFAEVTVFKKLGNFDSPLTYKVPSGVESKLSPGDLVRIPFRHKSHLGLVLKVTDKAPDFPLEKVHEVETVEEAFALPESRLKLAEFIADYYQCETARAIKLFFPKRIWSGKIAPFEAEVKNKEAKPLDKTLTPAQSTALKKIESAKKPVLLHGVTGSGKTELYLRLIQKAAQEGKQSMLLLPEIALTPQMLDYFEAFFPGQIAVFHSSLTDKKRHENWWRVATGQAKLILGSRSAIFAPAGELSLIIIDEEHEWTYKQESAPYYQTQRVAEELSKLTGAKLILGSATPSIETFYKVQQGDYELAELPDRVHEGPLPEMHIVDLREEFQKKNFSIFSERLQTELRGVLARGEQAILFVNQRGLASAVVCRDCGYREMCDRCDISLKYHRGSPDKLICHYCMLTKQPPTVCPSCQSPYIKQAGVGTQRVVEQLEALFPNAKVLRADKDTTKSKGFDEIYEKFKSGDYNILVGTQMVAKGHDFEGVSLIGIVLADIGLHVPDFRSNERLFQLITQVSGRCGRGIDRGKVILQTYSPEHFVIKLAADYDFKGFVERELKHREKFHYPPFEKMIKFTVVGINEAKLSQHIKASEQSLQDIAKVNQLPIKVLAAPALIPKMKDRYYYNVLIRAEKPEAIFDYWKAPEGWRVDIDPIHST